MKNNNEIIEILQNELNLSFKNVSKENIFTKQSWLTSNKKDKAICYNEKNEVIGINLDYIDELSEHIEILIQLKQIETISLVRSNLKDYSFLNEFQKLKSLNLSFNEQVNNFEFIKELKLLETLYISGNFFNNNFEFLNQIKNLKILDIRLCNITNLNSLILSLPEHIQKIYLQDNHLKLNDITTAHEFIKIKQSILKELKQKELINISKITKKNNYPIVYINAHKSDIETARKIKKELTISGFQTILSHDDIMFGEMIEDFIEKSIKKSSFMLSIISYESLTSDWEVLNYILSLYSQKLNKKYFIPCYIDFPINDVNLTDMIYEQLENEEKVIKKLIKIRLDKDRDISDLEGERKRLLRAKQNISEIIAKLKNSSKFYLDENTYKVNIEKLIKDLKTYSEEIVFKSNQTPELITTLNKFRAEVKENFQQIDKEHYTIVRGISNIQGDLQIHYASLIEKLDIKQVGLSDEIFYYLNEIETENAFSVSNIIFRCLDKLEGIEQEVKEIIPTLKQSNNWKTKLKFAAPLLTLFGINISFETEFNLNDKIKEIGSRLKNMIKK